MANPVDGYASQQLSEPDGKKLKPTIKDPHFLGVSASFDSFGNTDKELNAQYQAIKLDGWDDGEEDSDWEAPTKDYQAFKGEWMMKRTSNPASKDFREVKKIANSNYVDNDSVYKFADFNFIGFDLHQAKINAIFSNMSPMSS